MIGQIAIQEKLLERLSEAKVRNPSYSLRSFARQLDVSPSALSEIIQGKRRVSLRLALKLAERMQLHPEEAQRIAELFKGTGYKSDDVALEVTRPYRELNVDHFNLIAEWQHFAILSLAETEDFKGRVPWIARRLGISLATAEQSVERLLRLGLLKKGQGGRLEASGQSFTSPDGQPSQAIRQSHAADFRLAEASLLNDGLEARDFISLTMTADPAKIQKVKALLREFRDKVGSYCEAGKKKEVYKLCIQFFPLSKNNP